MKSPFGRDMLTMMTGSAAAQIIPVAISPILTRIYTSDEFGVFSLYIAIISILVVIATGQYENAILIPKSDSRAYHVTCLSIGLNLLFTIILTFIFLLFGTALQNIIKVDFGEIFYLLPISVFLLGLINIFRYWFIRNGRFKTLASNQIINSSINGGLGISFGLSVLQKFGLVLAQILAQIIISAWLIKLFVEDIKKFKFSYNEMLYVLKRYIKFPKISIVHGLFSNLSNNLPALILTTYFSPAVAGYYFLSFRVAATPVTIISTSFYQVFFQKFAKTSNKRIFYKIKFFQTNIVLIPIFILMWFIAPHLFGLIFGSDWIVAGQYTQIVLPLLYMKFLSNSFASVVYIYYEKQMENFLFGIANNLCILISLVIGVWREDVILGLWLMCLSNSSMIIVKLARSYGHVKDAEC